MVRRPTDAQDRVRPPVRFSRARRPYLNATAPRQDAPETGVLGDGRARRSGALDLIQRFNELVGLPAGRLAPGFGAVAEEPRKERVLGRLRIRSSSAIVARLVKSTWRRTSTYCSWASMLLSFSFLTCKRHRPSPTATTFANEWAATTPEAETKRT